MQSASLHALPYEHVQQRSHMCRFIFICLSSDICAYMYVSICIRVCAVTLCISTYMFTHMCVNAHVCIYGGAAYKHTQIYAYIYIYIYICIYSGSMICLYCVLWVYLTVDHVIVPPPPRFCRATLWQSTRCCHACSCGTDEDILDPDE